LCNLGGELREAVAILKEGSRKEGREGDKEGRERKRTKVRNVCWQTKIGSFGNKAAKGVECENEYQLQTTMAR
jgi:hypothetical protein